ncbi:MAG: DUF4124 domain-containing protein [Brachymonas sp.]|nr:DUF4124 domain-containing protein [Brachymonas sp.]MBP7247221.1 DUF4124 domain-containing protein [Brachymonas sp.]
MKNLFITAGLLFCCQVAVGVHATEIYTCTDNNGKQVVSDRPIATCIDREQKLLSGSGVVKKIVPPSYTAQEKRAIEERKKLAEQELLKAQAKERSIAMLAQRYPNSDAHQKARNEAAREISVRIYAANARLQVIKADRQNVETELEFYKKNPEKAPYKLREQFKSIAENEAITLRYIDNQNKDLAALHKRFDDEMALLENVWKKSAVSLLALYPLGQKRITPGFGNQ